MNTMKIVGIALVVLGVVGLVFGGIGYSREKTVMDIGPFKATTTEHKSIPVPPILGGVALAAGIALLVVPRRRLA